MSTIKVDTIATRTGSGNITLSNNVASLTSAGAISGTNLSASGTLAVTGNTTVGGTLVNTGLITASAGVAIGGTGSANTLDDYEEGTWTPGIFYGGNSVTATMNQTSGVYTKVGRIVHCTGMLSIANKNSGSGDVFLSGLPFTVADSVSHTSLEGNGVIGYYATLSAAVHTMTVTPVNSDTKCEVYTGASGSSATRATVSQFDNNAQIRFSFNYAV